MLIQNEPPAEKITGNPKDKRLLTLADMASLWNQDATARYEARSNNKPLGPVTGMSQLDDAVGGCLAPGLHVITGSAGAGKTAFALQLAADCRFPALYFTCEMQPLELLRRVTARASGTYLNKFKSGDLSPETQNALLQRVLDANPSLVLADGTEDYLDSEWLQTAANIVKGDAPHVLIVVDSLHSWAEMSQAGATEYERLNQAIAALRRISAATDSPMLCISERNRASAAGGLGSGAGTRKIEYSAETQLDLERDLTVHPDFKGNVPVKLNMAKNRNGAAGIEIGLEFNGAKQSFRESEV